MSTFLFVPASRLDRVPKAIASGTSDVILDLEDAIPTAAAKSQARHQLRTWSSPSPIFVRVNAVATEEYEADVSVLRELDWVKGVVLPKVESARDVERARKDVMHGSTIVALVESARGLKELAAIVSAGVDRLALGPADLAAELSGDIGPEFLAYPRARLVMESAAAGLVAPIDGPCLDVRDENVIARDASLARALGMGAKMCIHPLQVGPVADAFLPPDEQLRWARRVLDAADRAGEVGALLVEGELVDAPVLARARRICDAVDSERLHPHSSM